MISLIGATGLGLEAAAEQAPDAPALAGQGQNGQSPLALERSTTTVSPLRAQAPSAGRKRVLEVARQSIGEALTSLDA